ncbi:MAG: SPFH domain-containing protein [Alphaproteobacteria bacterium]|nr:SPFH domain-containing protein [Alphaproteobacteria bacterium]
MESSLTDLFMTVATYGGAVVALGVGVFGSFYTIDQKHKGLVTRFGKHVRTNQTPGLKFKIPLIEAVHEVSMQEKQVEENLETKTTDNLFVQLPIAIQFEVSDAAVYKFNKERPVELMTKVVAAAVREYTSGKDFQELYDERQQIKDAVLAKVENEVAGFGIQINNIVIDEPRASNDVKATFDRVRSSALEKDAAKNEADADYIKTVKRAEADKQRNILIGEGVAGFREKIAAGYAALRKQLIADEVDPATADRFMEEAMRLDTLRDVGDKGNMVIVTPDGSTGQQIAALQTLGQTVGGPKPVAPSA